MNEIKKLDCLYLRQLHRVRIAAPENAQSYDDCIPLEVKDACGNRIPVALFSDDGDIVERWTFPNYVQWYRLGDGPKKRITITREKVAEQYRNQKAAILRVMIPSVDDDVKGIREMKQAQRRMFQYYDNVDPQFEDYVERHNPKLAFYVAETHLPAVYAFCKETGFRFPADMGTLVEGIHGGVTKMRGPSSHLEIDSPETEEDKNIFRTAAEIIKKGVVQKVDLLKEISTEGCNPGRCKLYNTKLILRLMLDGIVKVDVYPRLGDGYDRKPVQQEIVHVAA